MPISHRYVVFGSVLINEQVSHHPSQDGLCLHDASTQEPLVGSRAATGGMLSVSPLETSLLRAEKKIKLRGKYLE